jgi:hypothetical protein
MGLSKRAGPRMQLMHVPVATGCTAHVQDATYADSNPSPPAPGRPNPAERRRRTHLSTIFTTTERVSSKQTPEERSSLAP